MNANVHLGARLADYAFALRWQLRSLLSRTGPDEFVDSAAPGRTVVLIPGIWESWRFLHPLARHLAERGHSVHVAPRLRWNGAPVASSAEVVASLISERDLRDVIIVAHSKGGLIGKYLMALSAVGDRIELMVAVASPFSGSTYAPYLILPQLRSFSPADQTTRLLAKHVEVNRRITSIYPAFDPHIPEGSALAGAMNVELPLTGHFRILGSGLLQGAVHNAVAGTRP